MTSAPLDWPIQAMQQALADSLPGLVVEVVAEIDSSNAELMRRARAGLMHPVLLVAERQSAARGRMGRTWQAPARPDQALSFSLGLPFRPHDWSGLSLAVGLALTESLHPDIGLKWPNDLWWRDHKLGGILIETANPPPGQNGRTVVIGVGLNLEPPQADTEQAFSTPPAGLRQLVPGLTAPDALLALAGPLGHMLRAFERTGFAPLVARFAARDVLAGRPVRLSDGRQGQASGVAADGALRLRTDSGEQAVHSAEVSVRPVLDTPSGDA